MKLKMVLAKAWFGWGFYNQKFDKNQFINCQKRESKLNITIYGKGIVIHFAGSDDKVKFLKIRLKHSIIFQRLIKETLIL